MSKQTKEYTIGIDVGGTKMLAVLFDGKKIIADDTLATPVDNLDHFLIMLKALVDPLKEKAKADKVKISGVGLGIAGVIDYKEGKMLHSPNISIINGVKVCEKIQKVIELPVEMDNDANCFIRSEMKVGAGDKFKNAYGVIVGTGIGGAWWYKGEVYKGAYGGAGEPGGMIIDFTSLIGLEEAYHKLTQNNPREMADEAYRGDDLAIRTFKEVGQLLGVALANIVNIIDPEIFILGGGAVQSSDLFFPEIKKAMKKYIDSSVSAKNVKVVKGKVKYAGAVGAALLIK